MAHAGEVLSQETLLEHVWDEYADPFTNTVRVTVGTLRRKLAVDDEPQLIETVVGRGYRLKDDRERRAVRPGREPRAGGADAVDATGAGARADEHPPAPGPDLLGGAVPAGRRW